MTGPVTSPATASGRSTVYAPRGAASTSHPLATGVAIGILEAGGNAIDAAVAAAAALNVVEPHMTGMGGDMFALLWDANDRRLVGIDATGKSGSKIDVQQLIAEGAGADIALRICGRLFALGWLLSQNTTLEDGTEVRTGTLRSSKQFFDRQLN